MDEIITVKGTPFTVKKLLGKGKGGYSYLAEAEGKEYVLKQIHHEPCDYYSFGNKLESELHDYETLSNLGIKMPKLLAVDREEECLLKEYIEGDTAETLAKQNCLLPWHIEKVEAMCKKLYPAGLNIDYYPTNFIITAEDCWYIDYECNEYEEKWDFEHWGKNYWKNASEKPQFKLFRITERPELKEQASQWFNEKWGIPYEAYLANMEDCISGKAAVPAWYLAMEGDRIIGGMGVIENDFHNRPDLAPNVCAVYTEADRRCLGVAGALLNFVCCDMAQKGINTLYLITNHTSFYERYGWEYFCQVTCDDGEESRMYIHKQ